jgi:hypothetical protein
LFIYRSLTSAQEVSDRVGKTVAVFRGNTTNRIKELISIWSDHLFSVCGAIATARGGA